jgi:signal transduction histidine kinase
MNDPTTTTAQLLEEIRTLQQRLAGAAADTARLSRERDELAEREREARAAAADTQRRFEFLAEASRTLGSTLDYQITLQSVARLAVPHVADWCAIDLVDEHGAPNRLAVAHIDPAKIALAYELQRRYPPDPAATSGLRNVLRTGRLEFFPDIPEAMLLAAARDDEHLRLLRALEFTSVIIAPLIARERILGAITLVSAESRRRYGDDDLALAEIFTQRAAQVIDNVRLYQETQNAVHLRDQFLSIASHELKTPLTSLLGNAQLLQRRARREGSAFSERDLRSIGVITDQAGRLNKLIAALLDIARIEAGHLSIERAPIDIGGLARRVVGEVQPTLEQHSLAYVGVDEPLIVSGDELRIEQVLQNLIGNAIKYSPTGGPVVVQAERRGRTAYLLVIDRGIGIPASALPRLFSRFFRASNVNPQHISGLGVGLYVVKEIVALHGGDVTAISHEGAGSTFTVSLPLLDTATPEAII